MEKKLINSNKEHSDNAIRGLRDGQMSAREGDGMKKERNFLVMCLLIIMSLGIFVGCGEDIVKDRVSVGIKEEYKEKFMAEEFTAEDFGWDNIEKIEYNTWHSTMDPERGFLTIHLKKHGKKNVYAAVEHFKKLEFVESVNAIGTTSTYSSDRS